MNMPSFSTMFWEAAPRILGLSRAALACHRRGLDL